MNTSPIVAHRGIGVENTKQAIQAGLANFDVEVDGQWINGDPANQGIRLIHDDILPGPTDSKMNGGGFYLPKGKKPVYEATLQELDEFAVFDQSKLEQLLTEQAGIPIHFNLAQPPKIAKLDDILPIPDGRVVYIELKRPSETISFNDGLEESIVNWVRQNNLQNKIVLISFNPHSLAKVKELAPEIRRGIDIYGDKANNISEAKHMQKWIGISEWLPSFEQTTPELVKDIHSLGLEISPWALDKNYYLQIDRATELLQMGVNKVITDYPQEVSSVIGARYHYLKKEVQERFRNYWSNS